LKDSDWINLFYCESPVRLSNAHSTRGTFQHLEGACLASRSRSSIILVMSRLSLLVVLLLL
jgi:hypothetical protein